jgi:Abortive infection C-terminus
MPKSSGNFTPLTIAALAEAITGGSASSGTPSVGHYRSAYYLKQFFLAQNVAFDVANRSRVPAVQELLTDLNNDPVERDTLARLIEAVADPQDFIDEPEKFDAVIEYMNKRLRFDECELRQIGHTVRLVALATNTVAAAALKDKAKALSLGSVHDDFERALSQANTDPAGAITAACSTVESVCKCILDEMGKSYPTNKDIKGLVGEVAKYLNLSPGRKDLPTEWEQDIRTILSGLFNVIAGIGSLRTHAGDAHGKGKNSVPADARIARLAIHAASTVSLFYIETWQRFSKTHSSEPAITA